MRLKLLSVAVAAALVGGCSPSNVYKDHSAPQIVSTRNQTNTVAQNPVGAGQNDLAAAVQQKVEKATTRHGWASVATASSTMKPMLESATNPIVNTPTVLMKSQAPIVTSGKVFVPINKTKPIVVTVEKTSLIVRAGETWERAFSRWFRDNGYQTVLYYFPGGVPTGFTSIPKKTHFSANDFQGAISAAQISFGNETNGKFIVSYDAMNKSAVIHVPGVLVQTFNVAAGSLKANAIRLTESYGWNTTAQDWRPQDDYYVPSSWPIVTERGDIASALNALIESYPVQPQLLKSTQHVYFVQGN